MNAKATVLASALRPSLVLGLGLVLALAACSRPGARQAQAGADAPDPGYRAAPEVDGVRKAADGTVSLSGRALPSSQVRMVSPAGARFETRADGSGVWTTPLGPVSEPALYRLAQEAGGQRVEAEGLIAVLPGAPTVAVLRAGSGAEVAPAACAAAVKILAVDYDVAGGAVVSGCAKAAAPVRVLVDGQAAIEGAAGPDSRFSLPLPKPLPPGRHRIQALTSQASAETEAAVTPPTQPKDGPYEAQALDSGWRIDWITPGGGVQTTLLPGG